MNKFDLFEVITQKIIDLLKQGVIPWQIPWKTSSGMPRNLVTNRPYNGINFWLLLSYNYSSPFFLTFEQAKSAGGTIKRGEKSKMVVFWKILESTEKDGTITKTPFLRYYNVFNYSQTEDLDPTKLPDNSAYDHDFNPIGTADAIIHNWSDCPKIEWDSNRACYSPLYDMVSMPPQRSFFHDQQCYSTLFHELIHSTGHPTRTNRHEKIKDHKFGSQDYSQEELVAEMGAAFLCGITQIEQETIHNNAAYISHWIRTFQNDPKVLILAATQAQKGVDYILNHQSDPNHAIVKYTPYHAPEVA
jgi:antirestriction protein ArdC